MIKCGADERCRRGLDRGEPLFSFAFAKENANESLPAYERTTIALIRKNNHSFNASCSCFHFMVQLDKGGDCMPFPLSNAILLIFGLFTYVHFRCGVYAYCRISKMSKSYIRKNTKGASNFWLYSQLHKQNNLGALYYLNLIYLVCLIAFVVALALSWISFLRIPVMIIGIILGLTTIPVFFASLI